MTNRIIFSPAEVLQDIDLGNMQRNSMIALGYALQAMVGTGTIVDGLACTPTSPASMVVNVGQGSIISLQTIDANAFGSLLSDTNPLVKVGINFEGATPFTLTAPGTSGQSINYLLEATLQEADTGSQVVVYFNPANPTQPFSGPANDGVAQNTQRNQTVGLQLKAGAAATTGTQTTPAVDSGWVGLYVIQVNFGQVTVTSGNITTLATAPFIPAKLGPGLNPGFAHMQLFSGSGTFTVPAGITKIKCCVWGGGGGGGSADVTGGAGTGGTGGGYAEGIYTVTPGAALAVTIGAAGAGSVTGSVPGSNGGTSSVGSLLSATGGTGGVSTSTTTAPLPTGVGGTGTGGVINDSGGAAGAGVIIVASTLAIAGFGGASHGTSVSFGNTALGIGGNIPGGGGSGGANGNHGGAGAVGRVVIEY